MSRAPDAGAAAWQAILELVAAAFTRPGHAIFADLAAGWVLCPGRRTITRIIEAVDAEGRRPHDAYHRFNSRRRLVHGHAVATAGRAHRRHLV